jgi:adenylate cyclase
MTAEIDSAPERGGLRLTTAQVRLASGLVLYAFAATHFLNHALGLWSFEAMQAMQDLRTAITRSRPGTALLAASATVHGLLGLWRFLQARTWQLGWRNVVQLLFGLLIPIFLIRHVFDLRGVHEAFGVADTYAYALWAMWPGSAWNQAILMLLVWVHASIGLHQWLLLKPWYRRTLWLWYAYAVVVPALSFAGFVAAARTQPLRPAFANPFGPGADYGVIERAIAQAELAYAAILGGAAAVWLALVLASRLRPRVAVRYAGGPTVMAPRGMTLLEVSRANRVPHASVCGGRARCSTCRVRVIEGLAEQPPPSEREARVLRWIAAPANVRLACQLRPSASLAVSTLLPAGIDAARGAPADPFRWGVERVVTVMFADLRGFTRMSEGKLPFDVVFFLNQFLGRMAEVIEDSGGFVDKFMGDGIMAVFGMDPPAGRSAAPEGGGGARQALAAARGMSGVLAALNQSLREDLPEPLAMGIGIHTGPVILGRIGATPRSDQVAALTALGETVNLASRLEGLTKDRGVEAIVSAAALAAAGAPPGEALERAELPVRGMRQPVPVWIARRATDLPDGAAGPVAGALPA